MAEYGFIPCWAKDANAPSGRCRMPDGKCSNHPVYECGECDQPTNNPPIGRDCITLCHTCDALLPETRQ